MSLVFQLGALPSAEAAGPWQAQVVSAETKQPLEGVVVLAWWTRHVRSFGGPSEEYRDSQEVLTDKDGRFTIESRWFFSLNPLVFYRGPFFAMFKSGHGDFEWPGYAGSETWPREKRESLQNAAGLMQLEASCWRCRRCSAPRSGRIPEVSVGSDLGRSTRQTAADAKGSR
jgi:hypothetical protein